jgi:hypothetical protein
MPREPRHTVFAGIYHSVVALSARDGAELWRTKLGGHAYADVHWDGEELFGRSEGRDLSAGPAHR